MIHELNYPFWVNTPKGLARAIMVIDRGPEMDLEWVTILQDNGQLWTWSNIEIRVVKNVTLQRTNEETPA